MGLNLFAKLQRLWASWDVRCFVLLSLFLQSILLLIAPVRKRSNNMKIYGMIWLTYLVADWTALFAVGLISDTQSALPTRASSGNNINDVMVFWSPFLLVHLGGPDTITAVALEDNELWARHLLKLLGQLVSTGLVFYRSFPTNELLLPTILMFLAGIIKYSERIRSLHRASFKKISNILLQEPDPGPNYAKLMEEYTTRSEAMTPVKTRSVSEPYKPFKYMSQQNSDHKKETASREMVRNAYCYYMKFRGLVADLIYSRHESLESRDYLLRRKPEEAFRVVEIELNFIYEVLYTKSVIIHDRAQLAFMFRFVYSTLVLLTFGLWYFKDKKSKHFSPYDVKITNTLLFGAIAHDVVSYCMLISSDWMTALAKMKEEKENPTIRERCMVTIGGAMDGLKFAAITYLTKGDSGILSRRWSESIQKHNLIDCCLLGHQLCDKLYNIMGIQDVMDEFKEVTAPEPFGRELRDMIFYELQWKARLARDRNEDADKISKARGEWVLKQYSNEHFDCSKLLEDWVSNVEYDESLILWHIATDLCYVRDGFDIPSGQHNDNHANEGTARDFKEEWAAGEMSKVLSDYMLHLLLREPKIMAEVSSIARIRFRDTVAEAEVFIRNLELDEEKSPLQRLRGLDQEGEKKRRRLIIKNLWDVNTSKVPPRDAKGDRSKSVLFDGCRLAKKLKDDLPKEVNKWELICSVWMEMLCYAAVHCRGNVHAATLGKGGQLVTLVWMLMMNLGLGKQFRIKEGNKRVKLVVADK